MLRWIATCYGRELHVATRLSRNNDSAGARKHALLAGQSRLKSRATICHEVHSQRQEPLRLMLLVTAQHSRPCFPQKSLCTTKRWAFLDVSLFLKRVWVVYASNGAVARTAALQSTVTCGRTEVCCVCERWPCTQAGRSTDVRWPRANAGRGRGRGGSHRCVVQRHR